MEEEIPMGEYDPQTGDETGTGYESTSFDDPYGGMTMGDLEDSFSKEEFRTDKKRTNLNDFYKQFRNPEGKVERVIHKRDGTTTELRERFNRDTPVSVWVDYAKTGQKKVSVVTGSTLVLP